jgi:LCP family protein required for cell wall assembly
MDGAGPSGAANSAVWADQPPPQDAPRRWRRLLRWTALALGVLLVLTVGLGYAAYRHYGGQVQDINGLEDLSDRPRSDEGPQGRDETYVVVGSDSAEGLTREQLRAVNTSRKGRDDGTRTDTVLLVQVPADGSRARVVSFPRDAWVTVPGHGQAKLNAAYDLGEKSAPGSGPRTLVATVEHLSGIRVDHYVEVSLYGFVRITDALGGVEVCLAAPARDEDARIDLPAGRQRLNGKQALAFVRQRKGLPGGDLGRIHRQQYFLSAVTREVLRAGTLLDPRALDRLVSAVTASVRVDPGTDQGDLLRLGLQARGLRSGAVRFQTVPVRDADARIGGQSVVLLDEAALPAFFADSPPPPVATRSPAPPPPPPLTVPATSIAVVVENGTTTPNLGARATDALARVGFRVLAVRDAARRDLPQTQVRYGGGRQDSARTVAAAVPGSALVRDDSLGPRGLVLTVGANFLGARQVVVRPQQDSGRGSAAVPRTAADDDCIA